MTRSILKKYSRAAGDLSHVKNVDAIAAWKSNLGVCGEKLGRR
jgi:hypothetical protein